MLYSVCPSPSTHNTTNRTLGTASGCRRTVDRRAGCRRTGPGGRLSAGGRRAGSGTAETYVYAYRRPTRTSTCSSVERYTHTCISTDQEGELEHAPVPKEDGKKRQPPQRRPSLVLSNIDRRQNMWPVVIHYLVHPCL